MDRPASSASVAEHIMFLMICAMFSIAQLFGGTVVSLEREKEEVPPHSALCFWLTYVAGIAVYCQHHVTCVVGE